MKCVVDELPYYEGFCPFREMCYDNASNNKCPQHWSKYKICSDDNPHECRFLIEACLIKLEEPEQESNYSDDRFCSTCKYFEDSVLTSPCSICIRFSNWKAKNFLTGRQKK